MTERSTTIFRKNREFATLADLIDDVTVANPNADLESEGGYAAAIAGSAIFNFEIAAGDLEEAARRQEVVAQLAQERIDQLIELRDFHNGQADTNRTVAGNLRVLLGARPLALEA